MISIINTFNNNLLRILLSLIVLIIPLNAQFKTAKTEPDAVYYPDTTQTLLNSDLIILYVPMNRVRVAYINKTKIMPKKEFTDSFFVESANDLINYECTQYFDLCPFTEGLSDLKDSIAPRNRLRYSVLKNDTGKLDSVSTFIKTIARRFNVDLILFPYACKLNHIVFQQKGWRQTIATSRPIKYKAKTEVHLQIWNKNGILLFEKIGTDQTRKPYLYSFFKKRHPEKEQDIATFANRFFAPPMIKSLSTSITRALSFKNAEQIVSEDE